LNWFKKRSPGFDPDRFRYLHHAAITYGDEDGGMVRFSQNLPAAVNILDAAATHYYDPQRDILIKVPLTFDQRTELRWLHMAFLLWLAGELLMQATPHRDKGMLMWDELCHLTVGATPLEFKPLKAFLDAPVRYSKMEPFSARVWHFGKEYSRIVTGSENDIAMVAASQVRLPTIIGILSPVLRKVLTTRRGEIAWVNEFADGLRRLHAGAGK